MRKGGHFRPLCQLLNGLFLAPYLDCSYQRSGTFVSGLASRLELLTPSIPLSRGSYETTLTEKTTSYFSSLAYHRITARHT
jgi:hypothetical protein